MNSTPIFNYYAPKNNQYIGLLSIPHSGEELPEVFQPFLSPSIRDLMQDVDFRVHELIDIDELQNNGIAVIKSNIIRVAIDLNRSKETTLLNWKKNSKGKDIVLAHPDAALESKLVNLYYAPYYEMLKSLIDNLVNHSQKPSVIDLHSMPSKAEEYHLKINPNQKIERPHFCLSDIEGVSCEKDFIDFACTELKKGYSNITQNDPYFGGHITRHIQNIYPKINNIQIEISRGIYMDEVDQKLMPDKVKSLKPVLTEALINTFKKFHKQP